MKRKGTSSSGSAVMHFGEEVNAFLRAAGTAGVRMVLVGGGAVNFHGYQRHSADLDFWLEPSPENFARLLTALHRVGYEVESFPAAVLRSEQNISLKMSPGLDVELITFLRPGFTFEDAWSRAEQGDLVGEPVMKYRVLGFSDLIESKQRSARPKDLLDIQELKRRRDAR